MHIYRLVDLEATNYEKEQGLNILEESSLLEYG